jgi:hypothetical protein
LPLLRGERVDYGRVGWAAAGGTCPLETPGQGLQSLEDLGRMGVVGYAVEKEGTTTSGRTSLGGHLGVYGYGYGCGCRWVLMGDEVRCSVAG